MGSKRNSITIPFSLKIRIRIQNLGSRIGIRIQAQDQIQDKDEKEDHCTGRLNLALDFPPPPRLPTTFPPRLELKSCLSPAGDQLPGAVTNPLDGDQLTRISLDSRQPLYCLARRHGICGMSRVAGNPWDRDMMHTHQGYHNGDNIKNQQNHLSPYIYTEGRRPPEALKPPYIRQDLIGAQLAL